MKFTSGLVLGFAATSAYAAAVRPNDLEVATTTISGPSRLSNTQLAIKSVMSVMSANKPKSTSVSHTGKNKSTASTKTVTGAPPKATAGTTKITVTKGKPTPKKTSKAHAKTTKAAPKTTKAPKVKRILSTAVSTVNSVTSSLLGGGATTPAVTTPATTAVSTSTTIATTTSAVALGPNDPCGPITYQYGYVPANSSMTGFLADTSFATTAANAITPAGYTWLFTGYMASLNQNGYMGYLELGQYTPSTCAAWCNAQSTCAGFDIYFERDPVLNPAAACLNPAMQTAIRCAFWSTALLPANAVNVGQWRGNFGVLIAGANGYNKGVNPKTATGTTSVAPHMVILSAMFATEDITAFAQANWIVGNTLVVNTTYDASTWGADPWPGNNKAISILYKYGTNETRIFNSWVSSGIITVPDAYYNAATSTNSQLVPAIAPPAGSNINVVAVTWGETQITTPSVFSSIYSAHSTGTPIPVGNTFFGVDPAYGTVKSAAIWYVNAAGNLLVGTGQEYTTISI